jgi:2-succinyl-5-enolpyruvyl-6-hydroxy-3-cyclohexene-1-carboxylate synthase
VSEADRAFAASWWLVDGLVRAGLEHACVSPGSRSTPIALALWRHPAVRVHVHLDERSSAFFALGIAKSSGRPVAVVTTSGTAAAELLPAIVEAWMSRTTLVALTADRPPELRGVGANQTIDQPEIFGSFVHVSIDAPVPGDAPDEERWRELARETIHAAIGPPPGPVHVNLPFREPLVPGTVTLPASEPPMSEVAIVAAPAPEDVDTLVRELGSTSRGLIVAGSMRETPPLVGLAERIRWPLLAEPTSGGRVPGSLSAGSHLLANERFMSAHVPDVVLQFGAAPTSRAGLELVRRAERLVIVDQDHLVADPHRVASWRLRAEAAAVVAEVLERIGESTIDTPWLREWREADDVARTAVDAFLDDTSEPFEGRVARDLAACLPDGACLVVGSSMPVRDLDAFMAPRSGIGIVANRGASGIDGFVSTALGVSATGMSTAALCGDLTLLHDAGALLWSAHRGFDAVFVVPNNDGGAIFSFLPQRDLPELDALFTTPHGLELSAVCSAAGAGHVVVERAADLIPAIERARRAGGVHVVEVPIDRERNVEVHEQVHAVVDATLRSAT